MEAGLAMAANADNKKKIAFAVTGIFGLGGLIAITLLLSNNQNQFLTLSGLDEKSSAHVQLEHSGGRENLVPENDNGFDYARPAVLAGNYIISATIESDGLYKDIRFGVDRNTQKIIITARGFKPKEALHIDGAGASDLAGLHFDWAGRIEIDQPLLPKKSGNPICLKTQSGFSVCHSFDAKGKA